MEFEGLIALSVLLFGVVEFLKTPLLKPAAQRFNLSAGQYEVVIHILVGVLGAFVIFNQPNQWNALTWADIYGYPVWAGNLVSVVFVALGDKIAHGLWDWVQGMAVYLNRDGAVG